MISFSVGINLIKNKIKINENINKKNDIAKSVNKINEEERSITKEKNIENNVIDTEEFDWYIEIPKIKLYAPIEEGTDDEILNRSVGHFEDTARRDGNCGLAAHNRGYRVNYFAKIKELEKGDIINYFVDGKKYQYEVANINVIYETDWSMLEEKDNNLITLITCIENRAEYRLCVQGVLID